MFAQPKDFIDDHVFIFGLARCGTTAILNAIYETGEFASLKYSDMPFILAPGLSSLAPLTKANTKFINRAHGDGVPISLASPEAFEEIFWNTFENTEPNKMNNYFVSYIGQILLKEGKCRYLSKNNQNIKRVETIEKIFPQSKKILMFRNPLQQCASLLSQHQHFTKIAETEPFIQRYMLMTRHTEFGPNYIPLCTEGIEFIDHNDINHWLEQWLKMYRKTIVAVTRYSNFKFVCYDKLCDQGDTWEKLINWIMPKAHSTPTFKSSARHLTSKANKPLLDDCFLLYKTLQSRSL